MNMQTALETLRADIIADYARWQKLGPTPDDTAAEIKARMLQEFIESYRVEIGSKYIKVIKGSSVWGFVVRGDTDKKFRKGDILMAASWRAPARNKARGNILDGGYTIRWTGPLYL